MLKIIQDTTSQEKKRFFSIGLRSVYFLFIICFVVYVTFFQGNIMANRVTIEPLGVILLCVLSVFAMFYLAALMVDMSR